jgi:hypothetical protein
MNSRLLFFATKNDSIEIFKNFCELLSFDVKYVKSGNMPNNSPDILSSIEEIPHLGFLKSNKHCSENYIILKKDVPIEIKKIISYDNDVFYSIVPSENITSMIFSPSGLNIDGDCLIHGQFAIMNENDISKEMMKMIKKALRNNCKLVRGWYVGHEAEQLNGKVRYITVGVNEPQEYDFKL